jgi:hypothetical protein
VSPRTDSHSIAKVVPSVHAATIILHFTTCSHKEPVILISSLAYIRFPSIIFHKKE